MSPESERMLLDFLRAQKKSEVSEHIKRVADWTIDHDKEDTERHAELVGLHAQLSLRVGAIEKDIVKLEDESEITGQHRIEELREQLNKREQDSTWLHQNWFPILISLIAAATALYSALKGH